MAFKRVIIQISLDQLLPDCTGDPVDQNNHNDDPEQDNPDPAPLPVVQGNDQWVADTTGPNQTQNGS